MVDEVAEELEEGSGAEVLGLVFFKGLFGERKRV